MKKIKKMINKRKGLFIKLFAMIPVIALFFQITLTTAHGAAPFSVESLIAGEGSDTVKIIVLLSLIAVVPTILLMMTCFGRIIIVLSFLRSALGLQQTPPNQILVGLALAITFFVMAPVFVQINDTALQPYNAGEINTQQFIDTATIPLKDWMLKQTTTQDVELFINLYTQDDLQNIAPKDLPMTIVVPAFVISELKRAFLIGFLLFIPFLIVDMIVASILMSMGMMMLPPVMISLPFKIMLFVVVDGWGLLVKTLVMTYN
ncbi:flagellar type III secretion system pore protein FliP [Acetobacterium sp.]|uniref:flagellar type III secretion system pore protein FliP n=1 Tax=Acetobacterium sp. TaxID=1872094 RepID=UPI002F40F0D9